MFTKEQLEDQEKFWQLVNDNLANLRNLVNKFHPSSRRYVGDDYEITAELAERLCRQFREKIKGSVGEEIPVLNLFDAFVNQKDGPSLLVLFGETWMGMPESLEVRREPGFGLLCDLCSDSAEAFYEEQG